ncbi:MAG: class I SAM-dependent methyltransferase [Porticoccaceae bacterium]
MRFTSLTEAPLGLSRDEIGRLFAPFVQRRAGSGDAEWNSLLRARKRSILRKSLRRLALGWVPRHQRRAGTVIGEYSEVWDRIDYASYDPAKAPTRYSLWQWGNERLLASNIGATRFRQLILIQLIAALKPRRVLEVGCGNGINLLLLAGRFPDVAFTGVELTQAGHSAARRLQQQATLPPHLAAFAPLPIVDPTAFRRIDFQQGDATALSFPDGSFDLVYTVLALEQMERVRERALAEIARVTGRHLFAIEPFRDVSEGVWARLYTLGRNYFQGRIDDLPRYGLTPLLAFNDFPQERFLKVCAVLAEKPGFT